MVRLARQVGAPLVDGPMLEDGDVGTALALVVDEHPEESRQQRPTQLGMIEGHGIDGPDGGWIARVDTQACMVLGPDEAMGDHFRESPA